MNPSPERSKECLPPKKRESRQGSTETGVPLDEFKPPVPFRIRHAVGRGEGGREVNDRDGVHSNPNPRLLHSPPALPALTPSLSMPIPWPLKYGPSVSLPLFPGQGSDGRNSGSSAWMEDPLASPLSAPLPHHSRWLRGEGPLSLPPPSSSSTSPSFKAPFPTTARDMWSFNSSGRGDYSPCLFSHSYLVSPQSLYPQDTSLAGLRPRVSSRRPNGLNQQGSRTASASRHLLAGDYGTDSTRSRLEVGPYTFQSNGGRRQPEDLLSSVHPSGAFLSDSHVSPEPHSLLQERHHSVKMGSPSLSSSSHLLVPDSKTTRAGILEHVAGTSAESQIYYAFGSASDATPHAHVNPVSSSSGTLLYRLQREPGPWQHSLRNSPHSPLGQHNSHDRSQRDRGRDQERDKVNQRERVKIKDKQLPRDKDQERDCESGRQRSRDQGRERPPSNPSTSSVALRPSSPALLPHFTKGSLIELASGRLKRVEELRTEDFLRSAATSPEFHLSTCIVLVIAPSSAQGFSHLKVHLTDRNTQELLQVLVEYPFFVQDRGWSSCSPQRTAQLYGLHCRQLAEGDVCLALTPTSSQTPQAQQRTRAPCTQLAAREEPSGREEMPPPPPPPPLPPQPPPSTPPAPTCTQTSEPPAKEQRRTRKRRWSAPDALTPSRTEAGLLDLPHGSKLMKLQ